MNNEHAEYEKLVAFAAGELEKTDATGIAIHTAICAECSTTVARFKTVALLMRSDDGHEPPPTSIARAQAIFALHRSTLVRRQINSLWLLPSLRQFAMTATLVLLILSNILTCAGLRQIAVDSRDAIPGDSFYPTKLAIEGIQLAVAWDTESKLARHIEFADFRVNELGALVAIGRLSEIANTLAAVENEVDQISATFNVLVKENYQRAKALGPSVETALSKYSTTLGNLRGIAADTVRPALESAISICNTRRSTVNQLYLQSPTLEPSATSLPVLTITPKPPAARSVTPAPARVITPAASSTPPIAPTNPVRLAPTIIPAVAPSNTLQPTSMIPTPEPLSTQTLKSSSATPTQFIPPGQLKKTQIP